MNSNTFFKNAKPVFLKGKSLETNFQAGFQCFFTAEKTSDFVLNITASTLYRVYLNGEFIHYGPARAPHGYMRVDRIGLKPEIGENILCVEVAGYNCPSFYTMNNPSFLQAEIFIDGVSAFYTGRDFKGIDFACRREKRVLRYSYQRAFTEVWRLNDNFRLWLYKPAAHSAIEETEVKLKFMERGFSLPDFSLYRDINSIGSGSVRHIGKCKNTDKRFLNINSEIKGFKTEECPDNVLDDMNIEYGKPGVLKRTLCKNEYTLYSLGRNTTGFICSEITAAEDSVVYMVFSEQLTDGKIECGLNKDDSLNIIKYDLKKGRYDLLESFECYTFRFLAIVCLEGKVSPRLLSVREYAYPISGIENPFPETKGIGEIIEAASQTFRQNTIDTFMDCPGRERGGYLCDGYFTALASKHLTGSLQCEKLFLENFLITSDFPDLPVGMLPMCYPGENIGKTAIPEWAMWFIVQLEAYGERGGETAKFKELVIKILDFFADYENSDGLLENLPYWNFVEWSDANNYTEGVNYPINMLYYKTLTAAYKMFGLKEFLTKSENVKSAVISQSYDGAYFHDHALRNSGGFMVVQPEKSAICQHEAFFFDLIDSADPDYRDLKSKIINEFNKTVLPDDISPLAIFIGYNIRMLLLNKFGEFGRNLREIQDLYTDMAETTGTLWEHTSAETGSLNHALNSCVIDVIIEIKKNIGS